VSLEGFSYPLEVGLLEVGDTLGFHNELIGASGRVGVEEGALLVIHETRQALEQSG
jgi:thiamine pyrophosphokinase